MHHNEDNICMHVHTVYSKVLHSYDYAMKYNRSQTKFLNLFLAYPLGTNSFFFCRFSRHSLR